jgi:GTP cyclohydrolase IA
VNVTKIEKGVELILKGLGVDLSDRNFIDTPERYARVLQEMFTTKETEFAVFPEDFTDFIMLRGHTLFSLCPHHLLPVEFNATVAYVPSGEVLGLSKLARILDETNDKPLLQERFTRDVVHRFHTLCPSIHGAACLIKGLHGCTKIRGVRSSAEFITYFMDGDFKKKKRLEDRFFELARR